MGVCIFCSTEATLTNEHIIPDWICDLLHDGDRAQVDIGHADWETNQPYTHKLKVVCNTCNTGWMATLEGDAGKVLSPLILGDRATTELSPEDQRLAAYWAVKTALIMEFWFRGRRIVPTQEIHGFYAQRNRRRLPTHWTVWVAQHVSLRPRRPLNVATISPTAEDGDGERLRVHLTTIAVGHLVLQVRLQAKGWRYTIERDGFPVEVAPVISQAERPLAWPPPYSLDHEVFEVFACAEKPDGPAPRDS